MRIYRYAYLILSPRINLLSPRARYRDTDLVFSTPLRSSEMTLDKLHASAEISRIFYPYGGNRAMSAPAVCDHGGVITLMVKIRLIYAYILSNSSKVSLNIAIACS